MNLLADIGNTVLKAALADGPTLGKIFRYQGEKRIDFLLNIATENYTEKILLCSANILSDEVISRFCAICPNVIVMDPSRADIAVKENIPSFITPDSAASIIAARKLFKGKGCSIFDFGTIIKYSFIDADGQYAGGNISPGCTTRFRSINRYARNLPLLRETDDTPLTGTSLDSSIRSGVVSGIMFEVEGYIRQFPENVVIFTGGDAIYFAKRTKNSIFAVHNLVMMGLALIADKNENKV